MAGFGSILHRLPKPAARWSRLFGLGILVGVLGGLAAAGLEWALHHGTALLVGRFAHLGSPEVLRFEWGVLLLPALGGLLSGLLIRWLCPLDAKGHGTDVFIRAFHRGMGRLQLRGPLVKAVGAAGVISCGGSAGPEGPTAALGSAIGSTVGGLFHLTPRERRILLVAGCAAGVGAIFRCPLGGALFAVSVLYREPEFESEAIVPSFVSSVIAYSTFMTLWGGLGHYTYLLSGAGALGFRSMVELVPYALLGPLCGLAAILFTTSLRFVEERVVPWTRLPRWFTPAVGGLATGALACVLPQVMDGRYLFIQNAMNGFPDVGFGIGGWALLFAGVVVAKCIATACTVGSGASGGALGPSVFLGGVVGAFLGASLQAFMPETFAANPDLRRALIPVGMGGVLATTMRTPLAAMVMVMEMTGSYGLIVPLMLVCVCAYVVGGRWGLNRQQVRGIAESPAHAGDMMIHLLESWRVGDVMEPNWSPMVTPDTPLRELVAQLRPGTRPVFAVAEGQRLRGLISVTDLRRIMAEPGLAEVVIASDIMTTQLEAVLPDEDAYTALAQLARTHHDVLPVVQRGSRGRWLGMLTRERIFERVREGVARMQTLMLEEHDGLKAIESEGRLQQLVMGVAPMKKDVIQRLIVPVDAVGQSLRQSDFRRKYGAQVIAIEKPDGSIQCPPDLDAPLVTGQRLLAIVPQPDGG
ncbi:MAG TPA: chloride channel protein [Phycisphaerae bacterium]|nr:chloride channel protein [Phycisphaerae bacterium]